MKTIIESQLYTESSIIFHRTPQVGSNLKKSGPTWSISRVANIKRLYNKAKEETLSDEILNNLP